MSFEVGDAVKVKKDCSGVVVGEVYTLAIKKTARMSRGILFAGNDILIKEDHWGCSCQHNWVKVSGGDFRFL